MIKINKKSEKFEIKDSLRDINLLNGKRKRKSVKGGVERERERERVGGEIFMTSYLKA